MKPSLVVLAAGMGSRYGGIKQLDGFGPNGERIIDYTVFDALKAGFGKVIFVIREAIEEDFKKAIYETWKDKGDIRVVYQELDSLPIGYEVPEGREKPWGTAHAVWMSEKEVDEPFAIVNADDFYGYESLKAAHDYLETLDPNEHGACLVGYELQKTLTDHGSVSRGVCSSEHGKLTGITERTKIFKEGDKIIYEEDDLQHELAPDTLVSMNLMGFSPAVYEKIRSGFDIIYQKAADNLKIEYGIPTVLNTLIEEGVDVPLIPTKDQWFGVTYAADKQWVKDKFEQLHKEEVYPQSLV
jgi:NDP-sugar pyrophosphorylase family protein